MSKLRFEVFDKAKKKKALKELKDYGIEKLPYLIVKWGKRLRIFSGNIDKETIFKLLKGLNVDSIGLYFASMEEGLRLSVDALHLLNKQINNGILEVSEGQAEQWFKGEDVELSEGQKKEIDRFENKFVILKNKDDFIGMGKRSSYGISNFMPKDRRIKN